MAHETRSVSAVIPAHNAEAYVREAIESVLAQTYPVSDCVVVDDGSTDRTGTVAREFGAPVRVIRQPNAGPGAARNRGAGEATGELLAFLDADDRWLPERIERQVAMLQRAPRFRAVVCASEVIDGRGRRVGMITQSAGVTAEDMLMFRAELVSTGSNLLIERSLFEESGRFDERSFGSEDWVLTFRIVARGALAAIDEPLVQYRVHEANLSSSAARLETEMLAVYDEVFADPKTPPGIRRLRRRAYANLYRTIAGAYFAEGKLTSFAVSAVRSLTTHPSTLPYFLATPFRRLRRDHGPRDPFAMARATTKQRG